MVERLRFELSTFDLNILAHASQENILLVNILDYPAIGYRLGPVLLPTFHYLSERPSDTNDESSISWYKPCGEIFNFLQLRYGKENTALYDKKGDLICFDSNEILREEIGFFIKEEALQSFLEENGYIMFWTILAEKRILQDPFAKHERNYPMPHISGVALRDANKEFSFEYKQIIE